jgi:hypothetical protein
LLPELVEGLVDTDLAGLRGQPQSDADHGHDDQSDDREARADDDPRAASPLGPHRLEK